MRKGARLRLLAVKTWSAAARLADHIAQSVLDVGRERVGHLVRHVRDSHRLGDHADTGAVQQAHLGRTAVYRLEGARVARRRLHLVYPRKLLESRPAEGAPKLFFYAAAAF